MPCTARPLRFLHQLPAERNDSAAHAGAARFIFVAAYVHAFAKVAAGFESVARAHSDEKHSHENEKANTAHAKIPHQSEMLHCASRDASRRSLAGITIL